MPGTTNQYYTVDEYKKIASAKKTEINKQLQEIPGRIDEAQRAIPDIKGLNRRPSTRRSRNSTNRRASSKQRRPRL